MLYCSAEVGEGARENERERKKERGRERGGERVGGGLANVVSG